MTMIGRFLRDAGGSALEKYAVGALVITVGAFFFGNAAEQYAASGDLPSLAFLEPGLASPPHVKSSKFNTLDYATTGSIKGQVVILDPCTGQQKN
jgi:hypothetical protein